MAELVQPGFRGLGHLQRGGDLKLPGRGQPAGGGRPQRGHALPGAQRPLAQGRSALVEQHRVDPLRLGGVLGPQIVVQLEQRPGLRDVAGRDPAPRQPAAARVCYQRERTGMKLRPAQLQDQQAGNPSLHQPAAVHGDSPDPSRRPAPDLAVSNADGERAARIRTGIDLPGRDCMRTVQSAVNRSPGILREGQK
jgi:hypothetical protein